MCDGRAYISGALLAVALASCSTDEPSIPSPPEGMDFEAEQERATPTTTLTIPDFKVTAYKQGQWGPEMLMNNVTVTRTGLNSWVYAPAVDWPQDEAVDFFAVSPAWVTMNSNSWWEHVVPYDAKDISVDLLAAVRMDVNQSSGKLKLNFRHTLARVDVSLLSSSAGTEAPRVTGVYLCNVADFGNFIFPHITTSPETNRGELADCWQVYNTTSTIFTVFEATDGGYLALSETPQLVSGGDLFFIPVRLGSFDPSMIWQGAHIRIDYQDASGQTVTARVGIGDSTPDERWLPGRSYSYTVDVKGAASRSASAGPVAECAVCDY